MLADAVADHVGEAHLATRDGVAGQRPERRMEVVIGVPAAVTVVGDDLLAVEVGERVVVPLALERDGALM
jgi:hypothetical protein